MYDFTPQEIIKATSRLYIKNSVYKYDWEMQIRMINELFNMEAKRMSEIILNTNANTATYAVNKSSGWDLAVKDTYDLRKQKRFPGTILYFDKNGTIRRTYIKRVIYSNPATIVFFADGSKTICKASEGDIYNPAAGLAFCVYKKMVGASTLVDVLNDWVPNGVEKEGTTYDLSIKDVRKKRK